VRDFALARGYGGKRWLSYGIHFPYDREEERRWKSHLAGGKEDRREKAD